MVRDANLKCGFELPVDIEKRRLMNWIENQSFDDVKKDMYTNIEQEAALALFSKQQEISKDPYLVYEVNKIHRVCKRKYQLQQFLHTSEPRRDVNQRKKSWITTEKLNQIVSKMEANKDLRAGSFSEMKDPRTMRRSKNAGIDKFYQEFY